jgi:hypothetical protein
MRPTKIAYVAGEFDRQAKAVSGTIQLFDEELLLSLDSARTIPFSRIRDVEIRRVNGVGTAIRITEEEGVHHLVVHHLNIGGHVLIIYVGATKKLFQRIRTAWTTASR